MWPALKDHDIVGTDSKTVSQLVADAMRNVLASSRQNLRETSEFQFRERHAGMECG